MLTGTEVKALRAGQGQHRRILRRAPKAGELAWSTPTSRNTARPTASTTSRAGRGSLLLHRKQIDKLIGAVQREGRTLVPTRLYFNDKGLVKLEVALAKGKNAHDKRATEADRDWKREQGRLMREKGEREADNAGSTPRPARRRLRTLPAVRRPVLVLRREQWKLLMRA